MLIPKKIQNILIIVGIIILLFIFKGWWKDKIIVALGGYVNKEVETVIEKEYIKGKVDTTAIFNHYVKTRGIILNPAPKIVYRDKPSTEDGGGIKSKPFKEFTLNISDTLLIGTARVLNDYNGNLEELELNYKPLFPKYITRVDTIKVYETKTVTLDNERDKIGVGVGYNTLNYASVLAGYTTKDGWQILAEYGKDLQQIKLPQNNEVFFTPSTDLISLKIIKNF